MLQLGKMILVRLNTASNKIAWNAWRVSVLCGWLSTAGLGLLNLRSEKVQIVLTTDQRCYRTDVEKKLTENYDI